MLYYVENKNKEKAPDTHIFMKHKIGNHNI